MNAGKAFARFDPTLHADVYPDGVKPMRAEFSPQEEEAYARLSFAGTTRVGCGR